MAVTSYKIPFNKPFLSGRETQYITDAVKSGKISGNGLYTRKCHQFLTEKYNFRKVLLTTSCTDALEMAAILADIQPGDEVIVPSYTFVSTALAFIRQGAHIVFADSNQTNPNLDVEKVEGLITNRTKAIVPVHYAGIACDMDRLMALAHKYNLLVIEDAAQAINSFYKGKPLGSIGHLAAFSFHETKNIIAGEGGMLVINEEQFTKRAEIIWEKGTNRSEFFRGEVNKYGWVDTGSSFLPSEIISAFLYAQLKNLDKIQTRRTTLWNYYYQALLPLRVAGYVRLPHIPDYATNNAHMFYLICQNIEERTELIDALKENSILAVFHYMSLHRSDYYQAKHDGRALVYSDLYTDCLVRLPLFYELTVEEIDQIVAVITKVYQSQSRLYAEVVNHNY